LSSTAINSTIPVSTQANYDFNVSGYYFIDTVCSPVSSGNLCVENFEFVSILQSNLDYYSGFLGLAPASNSTKNDLNFVNELYLNGQIPSPTFAIQLNANG
jgi:hypothetical protein